MNSLLLIIVLIISIYQLINKFINKEKYSIFAFMVATSCVIISNLPNTNIEIVLIDATEVEIERPKKNRMNTIQEKRKDIH